jgi:hypothetical protein
LESAVRATRVLTLAVDVRVGAEALLHVLELLDALDTLRLFLRVDEAREGCPELGAARAVGHATETLQVGRSRQWK